MQVTVAMVISSEYVAKSARGPHAEFYSGLFGKTATNAANILNL